MVPSSARTLAIAASGSVFVEARSSAMSAFVVAWCSAMPAFEEARSSAPSALVSAMSAFVASSSWLAPTAALAVFTMCARFTDTARPGTLACGFRPGLVEAGSRQCRDRRATVPFRSGARSTGNAMTWTQIATLIVSIAATAAAGAGVIVLSVNGIHSQVAALQTQAAADRAPVPMKRWRKPS